MTSKNEQDSSFLGPFADLANGAVFDHSIPADFYYLVAFNETLHYLFAILKVHLQQGSMTKN